MTLSKHDIWILQYLDDHCTAPDKSGFISIDRHWSDAEQAKTDHAKAIASSIQVNSNQLERLISRLEQLGLAGKTRTSTSLLVWITAAGQDASRATDVLEAPSASATHEDAQERRFKRSDSSLEDETSTFDVFLAHNSKDKAVVLTLASELQKRGLRPWLDSEQVAPGRTFQDAIQEAIRHVRSIAICIGTEGLGRWQSIELKTAISQCINQGIPVIPILLPGVTAVPESLPFLAEFNWIGFLVSIDEREPIDRLIWGITGQKPTDSGSAPSGVDHAPQLHVPPADLGRQSESGKPGTSGRVLFGLHGIRTYAGWNRALYEVASSEAWQVRTDRWNFGYFSVFAFLSPWAREAKVRWFREAYRDETSDRRVLLDKGECPSIIAHSFGSYILGNALIKYDWLRFNRVVLCGSILPVDFPWETLIGRGQVQAVRNEYGVKDIWCRWVRWFVAGTGPSGRVGFRCIHPRLEQKRYSYTHSEYFDKGHMESQWLPFLNGMNPRLPIMAAEVKETPPTRPWGLYALVLLLAVVIVSMYGAAANWNMSAASARTGGLKAPSSADDGDTKQNKKGTNESNNGAGGPGVKEEGDVDGPHPPFDQMDDGTPGTKPVPAPAPPPVDDVPKPKA